MLEGTTAPRHLPALHATGLLDAAPSASFDRLTRLASELLDVPVALVSLVDVDRQFFASCVGLPAPVARDRQTPLSHSFCAHVVELEEPLVVSDAREHPVLSTNPAIVDLAVIAYLGMPIKHPDGSVIGSFCAIDHRPRAWTEREVALMTDLAASVDTEVALHVALRAERGARHEAEESSEHLRILAQASMSFAESLDLRTTLGTLTRLAVPALADWCTVDLLKDGRVVRIALAEDDDDEGSARRLLTRYPPRLDAEAGAGAVLRSGQPLVISHVDEAHVDGVMQDETHRAAILQLGAGSAVLVPLVARGRTLGVLSFVSRTPGRYDDVVPLLLEIGRLAALAVDNATLYSAATSIARTLQHSLLPPQLPDIPGIELGRYYQPSGSGAEVGGDFYDVFEVPGGSWLAVIGDVVGKGPAAAAVTGLARHTLRAAAMRETAPSRILGILNDVLMTESADPETAGTRFATVMAVAIRVEDGGARCRISSGGHPGPLLRRADGTVEVIDLPGTVLGVVEDCALVDRDIVLERGDLLLLYTDGVTEARRSNGTFLDDHGLRTWLATAGEAGAQDLVTALGIEVHDFQGGSPRDDIALLSLRVLPN